MVYSSTGIASVACVSAPLECHMAATSGIPTLVVFAAPQKHTATHCSLDICFGATTRRTGPGMYRRAAGVSKAATSLRGGRAATKQTAVKSAYRPTFMKTLNRIDCVGSLLMAPVWKALEKVDLSSVFQQGFCSLDCERLVGGL